MARPDDMDRWTLADWEEWDAEQNANLDPEWVKKYGRQSFEAALSLFGYGSLLPGFLDGETPAGTETASKGLASMACTLMPSRSTGRAASAR
jgi:hypothetical protein